MVRCKTCTLVEKTKTGHASLSSADNTERPLLQFSWRLNKVLSHHENWSNSRSVLSAGMVATKAPPRVEQCARVANVKWL